MFGNPQIHAVGDVRLESPPSCEERLRLFYRDLIGLREPGGASSASQLAFEAHGRRVVIHLSHEAMASPMRRRLLIQVDSLGRMWERLTARSIECWEYPGMGIGDRRLVVLDPAGNRIELKEERLI